ncbi:MAG: neutral/alkaline non-lysosomal ceramidase N-terminal domain-containing protein, partial [Planctomycetota bacterium]
MNKSKFLIRCFLLFLFTINAIPLPTKANSSTESGPDSKSTFRAGAAVSNITPPLDKPVVGGWNSPPATHVHDELYAKCLVLDDGKTRLVFVVCDNLGISREVYDKAKRIINEKTSIPTENMMMCATHTHSSISARGTNRLRQDKELSSYQQFLVSRISDGVRRAINNLKPALIGWGSAQEQTQVFNRRCFMKPGVPVPNPFGGEDKVVMNPGRGNPNILKAAGPTDPQIVFLSIKSIDDRPIALLANYSLHYVGTGQRGIISADYFGVFTDRIQQLLGADRTDPPFVGILTNGTSGEKMQQVADLVAGAVYKAHKKLKFRNWTELNALQNELILSVRKPTGKQIAYAHKILKKSNDVKPYHKHEKVYARRTLQMQDTPAEVSVVLQTFQIGDLGICAIPFEVFVEIGLEMK